MHTENVIDLLFFLIALRQIVNAYASECGADRIAYVCSECEIKPIRFQLCALCLRTRLKDLTRI